MATKKQMDKGKSSDQQDMNKNRPVDQTPASDEQTDSRPAPQRQSAPKPTVQEASDRATLKNDIEQMQMLHQTGQMGSMNPTQALSKPIGKEQVLKATQILQKYKQGKANLEQRIIDNEQWWRLRNWECMRKGQRKKRDQVEPVSAWLFNCIANKLADAMDNFPSPNVLPREQSDEMTAKILTDIMPVLLDMNDFESTYEQVQYDKYKFGTGIYGVFWDGSKLNHLGDVSIKRVSALELFWQPGIEDIQDSRNVFHVKLVDNEVLEAMYPNLQNKLSTSTLNVSQFIHDDAIDTSEKSCVIDWYYKKQNSSGKEVVHYCKFVNDEVLFSSENQNQMDIDPITGMPKEPMSEKGFYDHGMYPFVFDALFVTEGTPCGFGYIDVGKSTQEYIDLGNKAIMKNMIANATPRHFISASGSVNEAEYADWSNELVHVQGSVNQDSVMQINARPLSAIYLNVLNSKIDELKETTGNRDVANGGTTSGVTAGSAIAAMQEAGSKLSRLSIKAGYRSFRQVVLICIELIRQFYDLPRCFRITGQNGIREFVQLSNSGLAPMPQGTEFGINLGSRIPLFDVEVVSEKQSPYSRMSQNELALQFYGQGFFNPQMADQALAALEMMDFPRKEKIIQRIEQNGGLMQQLMMLSQLYANATGNTELAEGAASQFGFPVTGPSASKSSDKSLGGTDAMTGAEGDNALNKKSRERVAESSAPR